MKPSHIIIIITVIISLGLILFFTFKSDDDKPTDDGKPTDTKKKGELTITGDGTEYYTMKYKRETYIKMPEIFKCDMDDPPDYCKDTDIRGKFVFEYDLNKPSSGIGYDKCSDGSHDCWYVEQFDDEGTLTGVVDKDGVSMLDVMADDLWSDKWDLENSDLVKDAAKVMEYKDDKLVAIRRFRGLEIGDTVTVNDLEPAIYFAGLFTSMKLAGLEKPEKITLKVKNAKSNYEKFKKERMR
tara:strand:- start:2561 stop:3280 length:720 start_codon:yes stop_codon:yes gene_type:complete